MIAMASVKILHGLTHLVEVHRVGPEHQHADKEQDGNVAPSGGTKYDCPKTGEGGKHVIVLPWKIVHNSTKCTHAQPSPPVPYTGNVPGV